MLFTPYETDEMDFMTDKTKQISHYQQPQEFEYEAKFWLENKKLTEKCITCVTIMDR